MRPRFDLRVRPRRLSWVLGTILVSTFLALFLGAAGALSRGVEKEESMSEGDRRNEARKAQEAGNHKDALEIYRALVLDPSTEAKKVGDDLAAALDCYSELGRDAEIDALREKAVALHAANWRLLWTAARTCLDGRFHHGFIVSGTFQRGNKRGGGGNVVNVAERDRVRALQLFVKAVPGALAVEDRPESARFFRDLAEAFLANRGATEAWRLQYLSALEVLPDPEPGWGVYRQATGAPVDPEGKPIYHSTPETFEAAKTDGERWRWCLETAMELDPARKNQVLLHFADFLSSQFGAETVAYVGGLGGGDGEEETGTWALAGLAEDETIARLATGLRRFTLPREFDFLRIFREVADSGRSPEASIALERLASIHENRRQYPRAAEYWKRLLAEYADRIQPHWKERLDQIEGAWGRFDPIEGQAAGKGATVEFRFRNAKRAEFTAKAIRVPKLLDDVRTYLKSRPKEVDWQKLQIEDLGYRLLEANESRYIGDEVARWTLDLEPRTGHVDRRITVTTPLSKPGAYLLEAQVEGGNTCFVILWVSDTIIVRKPQQEKVLYYVADAVTGKPIAKATLSLFGWSNRRTAGGAAETLYSESAQLSSVDGLVVLGPAEQPANYQWVAIARTDEGRLAYLGFSGVWYSRARDPVYDQRKVFAVSDRPVYRPGQKVQYKLWIARARYGKDSEAEFAGKAFTVEIRDARGQKVSEEAKTTDAWGGVDGTLALGADASLGVWRFGLKEGTRWLGQGTFRVEEYKKPEFEVSVEAPTDPVLLGDAFEATVRAKYYFGSPVTHARVKYKVLRTRHDERWFPPGAWDWLYGPGYGWYAADWDWYPGFHVWGCRRPWYPWWTGGREAPEVIAEGEGPIGEDGTLKVRIDTSSTKAIHPDQDHRYAITAEVVDESRRTIVGAGDVIAARQPFRVYVWVDRGHYRVGDTVQASVSARRADGKPVEAKGEATLLKIRYAADGPPVEMPVQTWKLALDPEGRARQQLTASEAGQYRLSFKATDAGGRTIEGAYIFSVLGEGFDASQYRFQHLELTPDKAQYAPGESVKLLVGTERASSTVLLFTRVAGGVYPAPRVLRLEGRSRTEEIAVTAGDMPNFYVEALTVADGRVHVEVRELIVPPEDRVLTVDVRPSSESYRPGEKAKVAIRLTDPSGKPVAASTVIAIYDKSVEYIAGGSNVPEIRSFFWKWRRSHSPRTESSAARRSGSLVRHGDRAMGDLGLFGAGSAEEAIEVASLGEGGGGRFGAKGGRGGGMTALAMNGATLSDGASPGGMSLDSLSKAKSGGASEVEGGETAEAVPVVRKEFADTALWIAALETKPDGTAEVELAMPENLTTWRVRSWALGTGTRVGEGSVDVVTRKNLLLRLQAPRFFVERDEVVLSANVHNYLSGPKAVRAVLELEGACLEAIDPVEQKVLVEAGGEARVDWRVRVVREGEAVVRMKALSDEESDAMEMRFPSHVHGIAKWESWTGVLRPEDASGKVTFRVPAERRVEATRLEVRWSPSLAGALVDALPYLVDYPYGCTEQTLNRFLPAVTVQKILIDLGIDLEAVSKKRTNLQAAEVGDDRERAAGWKRFDRNPVFDTEELAAVVRAGVRRLGEMQLSDGGWGWFSGWGERSDAHTTATVVRGLIVAKSLDVAIVPEVLAQGLAWLERYQAAELVEIENGRREPRKDPWKDRADELDALVYCVLAEGGSKPGPMGEHLYRDRTRLAPYALGLLGLAYDRHADREKLAMILRNLSQYLEEDEENQTAWLRLPASGWWHWYGSEYEAHAAWLKLLARTDPKGKTASRLVKYLLQNRKHASYWNSTRDTALCIDAMADFLRASGEAKPELTLEVWLDGKLQKAVEITAANFFAFDNKLVLEGEALATGEHTLEIRREGKGPVYYSAYLATFTLEEFIQKAGLEVKVERSVYKLRKVEATAKAAGSRGQALDQKVEKYERTLLESGAVLASGDLVEVELSIEAKNDYEYLVFEDYKAAGFEAVELRSGYTGNALRAYVEFRDDRAAFFCRTLARGKHSVSYRLRAEIPGKFSALPARGWAMYAPELKANSDEIKLGIEDKE